MALSDIKARVEGALTALKAVNIAADSSIAKKDIIEALRLATTGYGVVADSLKETLPIVKALHEEAKAIKKRELGDNDKFIAALTDVQTNGATAIENVIEELNALPADMSTTGPGGEGTGTRTVFAFPVFMKNDETKTIVKTLQTGEIAQGFIASPNTKRLAFDKTISIAKTLRDYLTVECNYGWNEPKEGSSEMFYMAYRLIRPTVQRQFAKWRIEASTPQVAETTTDVGLPTGKPEPEVEPAVS